MNGDELVRYFRRERFVEKTKKLSATISKRKLPQLDSKPSINYSAPSPVTSKMIAAAQRDIDIVKEQGMELKSIYAHDILPVSSLLERELPTKPNKSALIAVLEKILKDDEFLLPARNALVILDFMSKIRSFPNLASFGTFENAIHCVLSAGHSICSRSNLHIVFDSYLETSVKGGARLRRAGGVESVDLAELSAGAPMPQQVNKFWNSSINKTRL